ncbi:MULTISPECIES: IS110 family transposase [Rhizobium]|uniref:IS110 family transposase n=1 Tax=Rhizobium TaxID=379 RepID=UPI001FF06182|nr:MULTISPECIES: transposase [Rhizobium]
MQGKVSFQEDAMPVVHAGLDVSKVWLDAHLHPRGESRRFSNEKAGIRQLKRLLAKHRPKSIGMEATGKLHRPAHRSLWLDGFAVAVVDPLRARMFARACGYLDSYPFKDRTSVIDRREKCSIFRKSAGAGHS